MKLKNGQQPLVGRGVLRNPWILAQAQDLASLGRMLWERE